MNYLTATRVDPATGKCPGVYEPCSTKTSTENTICYHPADPLEMNCPITFVDFIPAGDVEEDGTIIVVTDEISLTYSRNEDSLPIVSTFVGFDAVCLNNEDDIASCKKDLRYRELGTVVDLSALNDSDE